MGRLSRLRTAAPQRGQIELRGVEIPLQRRGRRQTQTFRNDPQAQYVADIAMLAGFAIFANSTYTWITCLLGMVWFVLAPFTEEPWLRDQFGIEYDLYMKRVPRFLSFKGQGDPG